MATTRGRFADMSKATHAYPELLQAFREQMLHGLRDDASRAGLDITTETNLTWPGPVHYRFEGVGEDTRMIEVPEDEAAFTRFIVEATYERLPRG